MPGFLRGDIHVEPAPVVTYFDTELVLTEIREIHVDLLGIRVGDGVTNGLLNNLKQIALDLPFYHAMLAGGLDPERDFFSSRNLTSDLPYRR